MSSVDVIVKQWLLDIQETLAAKDLDGHMALISKQVNVRGIPGFDSIGYDDWYKQCQHEFDEGVVASVEYGAHKIVANNEKQIMFKTIETLNLNDGSSKGQGIEILLTCEPDGQWRVTQERILSDDETQHANLKK